MSNWTRFSFLGLAALGAVAGAWAVPGWFTECEENPETPPPPPQYSPDYGTMRIQDALIGVSMGVSGTSTWGGQNGFCYSPSRTLDASGRFAFFVGNTGSVQSTFDDGLALTTGAPTDPVGDFTYAKILKDGDDNGASVLYGDQGLRVAYVGASKRYAITAWGDADVDVECQIKVLGDAVRLRWRMRNLKADPQRLGILWASYTGMISAQADSTGATQAHSLLGTKTGTPKLTPEGYIGWSIIPTGKPIRNWRRYDITNPKFPSNVKLMFGQSDNFGIRFDNLPGPETPDANSTDLWLLGNHGFIGVGALAAGNNISTTLPDGSTGEEFDTFIRETTIAQRFPAETVAPGESRDVIHYVRSTWGVANYEDPYTAVLDGPSLIATDSNGQNGLTPNPFTVRAYVDNQYATLDREVDLQQVRLTIFLPKGLSLAPGESQQKTLDVVSANAIRSVDWRVVSDGKTFGKLPYQVTISPNPGPTKTLSANVLVSATPRMDLPTGASLVTIPYKFQDTSMDDILKLKAGQDYVAYRYDPDQSAYIPAITVDRGSAYWILPKTNLGSKVLEGAQMPTDQNTGGLLVNLHQGWNLIGNPYTFPVPLSQLVLVAEDSPKDSYTWIEAVQNNFVQSSLIYWQRDNSAAGGSYVYTQGVEDVLQPHFGYWVYVSTFKPVRISWPAVYAEGLPNSGRSVDEEWNKSDRQWRLQLSARTVNAMDSYNFVGVTTDKKKIPQLTLRKAPSAPQQPVELSIESQVDGKTAKLAQAITDRSGKTEWNVNVKVAEPGEVTVTWPNLPSTPRKMRFRVTDLATGENHDLRSVSGYTFRMNAAGVRKLKLTMEPGGSSRPVIGNVLVTRPGRAADSPVNVSYSLSADALVTVRVLSGTGKEVFTVTRGRADSAGQNSAKWAMRDSANRAVAPGVYRIEILAETPDGERVRRIVPVTVTR
ncbi:MAG: hypothetical protein JST30_02450 [Armatimonadetes bacterium]|nr:hypothetical protein [Armatimonadota bacterium]